MYAYVYVHIRAYVYIYIQHTSMYGYIATYVLGQTTRYSQRQREFYTVMAIFTIIHQKLSRPCLARPKPSRSHEVANPYVPMQHMLNVTGERLKTAYEKFDRFAAKKENASSALSKPLKINEHPAPLHLNPIAWVPSLRTERHTRCCLCTGDKKPFGRRLHDDKRAIPLSHDQRNFDLTPPPGCAGLEEAWLHQRRMDSQRKRKSTMKKKEKPLRRRYVPVKQLLVCCTVFGITCVQTGADGYKKYSGIAQYGHQS